jgi:hypothetical protein
MNTENKTQRPLVRLLLPTLCLYIALAGFLFLPLFMNLTTHILADDIFIQPGQSDAYNFLWTYWWFQKALSLGKNLFICDYIFPPTGENLFFHTHILLPSVVTMPLGKLVGTVTAYNVTILGLLILAALLYFSFAYGTFFFSFATSFALGAFFGFSPYFIFKAHCHPNLIGGLFWGGALAVFIHACHHDSFTWKKGLLFALFYWATFWTSFLEFFMVNVVLTLLFVFYRVKRTWKNSFTSRLAFIAPLLPGLASFLVFSFAAPFQEVNIPLIKPISLLQFVHLPRLCLFYFAESQPIFEYWGTYIPFSILILAYWGYRNPRRTVSLIPLVILFLLTIDCLGIPSSILRMLPLGQGFRVMARFFPFFLFWLLLLAGFGLDRLFQIADGRARRRRLFLIGLLAAIEFFPFWLRPSPVKQLAIPPQTLARISDSAVTAIIPKRYYFNHLDAYQISLQKPVLKLSYLARPSKSSLVRMQQFPALYQTRFLPQNPEAMRQFISLGGKYLLFEDKERVPAALQDYPRLFETAQEVLLEVPISSR